MLNKVRLQGDWESWLSFFAEAVEFTAGAAVDTARQLMALAETDARKLSEQGRLSGTLGKLHQALLKRPIATPNWLMEHAELAPATVSNGLRPNLLVEVEDD